MAEDEPDLEERLKIEGDPEDALRAVLGVEPDDPGQFFARHGFALRFSREGETVWANLDSTEGVAGVPKYGRGDDEASAAARAVQRWRSEQAARPR